MTTSGPGRHDYRALRSILETPILDDRKWGKLPGIPADAVFLDLEDSVAPAGKEEARERAVRALRERAFDGTKLLLPRPNHLTTPWGADDIEALAGCRPDCVVYPKISSADDVREVQELFRGHGADPDIFAIIETSRSVLELRDIATVPGVVGLMSGPGDISVDAGVPLYEPDGALNGIFHVTKTLTALAGAAYGLATTDIAYAHDIRDLAVIRDRVRASRRMGFTAMTTFYPPHVDIINDEFTPGEEERRAARECVAAYEEVLAGNRAAALSPDGEPILVHDYEKARSLLARAER
ncbi:CoA ester lyase [Actinomadura vinacea]|uniref:CoA ester lyase n=1 Tax=Actinomadura vinacea TaxID=115336 RepID=A0ABP5VK54_9ACTN